VGNPHSTVIKLIRQNASDLEEFGNIRFEIQNSISGRWAAYRIRHPERTTVHPVADLHA